MPLKQILNPSFLVACMELQDAIADGWRIDPVNYPAHNFTHFEINLVRDDAEAVQTAFSTVHNPTDTVTPSDITSARKPVGPTNEPVKITEIKKPVGRPATKGAK